MKLGQSQVLDNVRHGARTPKLCDGSTLPSVYVHEDTTRRQLATVVVVFASRHFSRTVYVIRSSIGVSCRNLLPASHARRLTTNRRQIDCRWRHVALI